MSRIVKREDHEDRVSLGVGNQDMVLDLEPLSFQFSPPLQQTPRPIRPNHVDLDWTRFPGIRDNNQAVEKGNRTEVFVEGKMNCQTWVCGICNVIGVNPLVVCRVPQRITAKNRLPAKRGKVRASNLSHSCFVVDEGHEIAVVVKVDER